MFAILAPLAMLASGLAIFGAATTAADPDRLLDAQLLTLAVPAGAVLITTPALFIWHSHLRLPGAAGTLFEAVSAGTRTMGELAFGLVPVALLSSLSSGLGPLVRGCGLGALVLLGLLRASSRLQRVFCEEGTSGGRWLAGTWVLGTGLVALRIAAWMTGWELP